MRRVLLYLLVVSGFCGAAPVRMVLEPKQKTILSNKVTSTVAKIQKWMGESVSEGEEIVSLESTLFDANYRRAVALERQAIVELEAQTDLFKDKVASLVDLKKAETQAITAKADLTIAKAQRDSCHILSPFSGKVSDVLVDEFQYVEVGTPIVELINDSVLKGRMLVSEVYVDAVAVGDQIQVTFPEREQAFEAIVTHLDPVIDPASGTFRIDADIDNATQDLKVGMIGVVQIDGRS